MQFGGILLAGSNLCTFQVQSQKGHIIDSIYSREASSRMTHDLKHLSRDQVKKSECIFVILTTICSDDSIFIIYV